MGNLASGSDLDTMEENRTSGSVRSVGTAMGKGGALRNEVSYHKLVLSLVPAACALSHRASSFPVCSPRSSTIAPGSNRASCELMASSHTWSVMELLWLPQTAEECSEEAKEVTVRDLQGFWV